MELKVDSALIGRVLAGVIVFLALVSAVVGAASARSGAFDIFLWRLTGPMGVGFLILVGTEILRVLEASASRDNGGEESGEPGE